MNTRIPDVEANKDPEEVGRHIQKGIETGFDRFETVQRRKDQSTFDVEVNFRYLSIEGGRFAESMSHVYGTRPQVGDCIFDNMKSKDDIEKVKEHYD